MSALKNWKILLGVAIPLSALALGVWLLHRDRSEPREAVQAAVRPSSLTISRQSPRKESKGSSALATAVDSSWSPRVFPDKKPLFVEIGEAPDLKAFVERVGRNPGAPDEKAYVALALGSCQEVSVGGVEIMVANFIRRIENSKRRENIDQRVRMYKRGLDRCKGFTGENIEPSEVQRLWDEAAEGGSPLGLSHKLFQIERTKGPDAARQAFIAVLDSQDPVAIMDSLSYAKQPGYLNIGGPYDLRDSDALGTAWALVACDLGLNCGPNSSYVIAHCALVNQCADSTVELQRMQFANQQDWDTANAFRQVIRVAIVSRNWSALGLR